MRFWWRAGHYGLLFELNTLSESAVSPSLIDEIFMKVTLIEVWACLTNDFLG